MKELQNKQVVIEFYKSWETIPVSRLSQRYREYLAPDVVFQVPGSPAFEGLEAAVKFMDDFAKEMPNLPKVNVHIKSIVAEGDLVYNERVDEHCDADGRPHIVVEICSTMTLRDGKITRWREYLDPKPFHDFMDAKKLPLA